MYKHNIIYGIFQLHEVLPFVDLKNSKRNSAKKEYCGFNLRMGSERLKLFATKGVVCCKCGIVGKYFKLENHNINNYSPHFNLYAIDKDGKEVLMTKDHIIPVSKGGEDKQSNYQPMCTFCNCKKDNKIE
jgi:5-methylcytosine-specific restriction endonuclease McrA